MTVWLTCFLVEKKVQRKHSRTVTISTPTSSSKTYTYEVSSVRKTLMEMFDMPMIKIHSSDDNNSTRPSSLSSDKSETNEQEENCKSDSEDFNCSADVFAPEPSGYSTSSSDDLKEPSSSKAILLDVPDHKLTAHDDFAHWIPMAKTQGQTDSKENSGSPQDSPSKKELANFSPKHSPKKGKQGGKKHNEYNSPNKPKKEIKLHPPILKSAMKSPHRKKHAAVRVAMEDEIVFTRPSRSNNNYIEMNSNAKTAGNTEKISPRESPNLPQICTKL
ncbi:hypothetical protein HOLleu_05713 [Holothuria leucospilota]|uniref:Uncharacterized protein n=1 Tax=Holothuria leucospilota TaxID=206669 RepID=A0A9Q1CLE5_HOLLE|nr:hypothetical protein HOLleu_05713 [Holothuria leucospilota]